MKFWIWKVSEFFSYTTFSSRAIVIYLYSIQVKRYVNSFFSMADIGTSRDWNITLQILVKIEPWNCVCSLYQEMISTTEEFLLENYINTGPLLAGRQPNYI